METEYTHFAHRESSGLVVDLHWDPADASHEFRVQVVERGADAHFVVFPTTSRAAVEAFHHPFASRLATPTEALTVPYTTNSEVHLP